jgi:hypothetical protein
MSRSRRSASVASSRQSPRRQSVLSKKTSQTPDTETESLIENDYSGIRLTQRRSLPKPIDPDVKRFNDLCGKIEEERRLIAVLSAENATLKAEIARCQEKIANYPKMKRKYDLLSQSLSQIAESRTHTRTSPPK